MRFDNTVMIQASVEKVWNFFGDHDKFFQCIPGVYKIDVIEPQAKYTAYILEKVGPFKVNFAIDVEMERAEAFRHIRGKAAGRDSKIAASFSQKGDLRFEKISDLETKLDFTTEVSIFGKLATLGNWIIKKKADEAMGQFVRAIKIQLENGG